MANLKEIYSRPDRAYFLGIPIDIFNSKERLLNRLRYLSSYPCHSMVLITDFRGFLKACFLKKFRDFFESSSIVFSNSNILRKFYKFFKKVDIKNYDDNVILHILISVLANTDRTCYIIDKDKIIAKQRFLRLKESYKEIKFIGYYDLKAIKLKKEDFFLNINKLTPSVIISFCGGGYLKKLFYKNKFNIRTHLSVFFK